MPNNPRPSPAHPELRSLTDALDARRAAFLALPEKKIARGLKLDAFGIGNVVAARARQLLALRAELVAALGENAGSLVDDLAVLAEATMQADVEVSVAPKPLDVRPLRAELAKEHTLLFTDAQSLANRGLLAQERIDLGRKTRGYDPLIQSTMVLISILREHWASIASHTPLQAADLDRAEARAGRLVEARARRKHGSEPKPARDLRDRALTSLVRHYDEVRRVVTYVRWHQGDADELVPSLFARNKPRRRRREAEPKAEPNVETPTSETGTQASRLET
jgi:hypothetical protein